MPGAPSFHQAVSESIRAGFSTESPLFGARVTCSRAAARSRFAAVLLLARCTRTIPTLYGQGGISSYKILDPLRAQDGCLG